MRKTTSFLFVLVFGFTLAIMMGQTTRTPPLDQRVSDLERRVTALENQLRGVKPSAPVVTPPKTTLSAADLALYIGSSEAQIFADDGEFLGNLSSQFSSKSIGSDVGSHGSSVGAKSMFNSVSKYGSTVGAMSAFNNVSTRPPKLLYKGEFICYVSVNSVKTPRVHPHVLRAAVRGE